MRLRLTLPTLLGTACLLLAGAAPAPAGSPVGKWLTESRDGVIDVYACGAPGRLCARVAGMEYAGPMPRDVWKRPKCGEAIMTDLRPDDGGGWSGHVLDPDSGKTYSARLWLAPDGTLKLRGYIGLPMFGETQSWTRFHGRLGPACHLSEAEAR